MDLLTHSCQHVPSWANPPATGFDRVNASPGMVENEMTQAVNALEWTRAVEGRERPHQPFLQETQDLPAGLPVN
jgi:hypothetical protein